MGGFVYKGGVGAFLCSPSDWKLEPEPDWIPKLAAFTPLDESCQDYMYVNIWNWDKRAKNKEKLNKIRKYILLKRVCSDMSFKEWNSDEILFRQNKAFSMQNILLEDREEICAYRDMQNFILEIVLISSLRNINKNIKDLQELMQSAFSLEVEERCLSEEEESILFDENIG